VVWLIGGTLTDHHATGLLATHSVAISPVSPVFAHHHHQQNQQPLLQHQPHHQAQATPRQVDFVCSSPPMMPAMDDDARVLSYAQPTALDGFCSPPSTMTAPVCTTLVGVGFPDDRPASNSALQLIDYLPPARTADCSVYEPVPVRADLCRPMNAPPPGSDLYAGELYRAFSMPTLKSELV